MRIVLILTATSLAVATAATAQSSVKTRDYTFDYSYPAAAAKIAPLRTWLEADRARVRAETAREAASARADSGKGGFPFRAYDTQKTWEVVTSTPRFLSLSGNIYEYTGGAHGTPGTFGMVWDRKTSQRLDPRSLFVSPAALQTVFGAKWCAWLKGERTRRIGANADGGYFTCPPVKDLTLLLGSTDGRRIDRIGLIADPYVAGSYAEGEYETTIPVTAAVLQAVKPAYRAEFAAR